jgi:hypothetical protein
MPALRKKSSRRGRLSLRVVASGIAELLIDFYWRAARVRGTVRETVVPCAGAIIPAL